MPGPIASPPRRSLEAHRPRRHPPLLHQHPRRRPARPRYGLYGLLYGQFDLSESCRIIRDVAKALPLENILIETDSPYLAPQPCRGKRNEPAYVAEVAQGPCECEKLTGTEEIAAVTAENFRRFFQLAQPECVPGCGVPAEAGRRLRRTVIALLTAKEIFELVREDLVKVEQELSRQSAAALPAGFRNHQLFAGRGREAPCAQRCCCFVTAMPPALTPSRRSAIRLGRRRRTASQRHADPRRCDR